ncbi:DUF6575 domain-containing protein [Cytobacillus horneckiae]|uniref:DUF6575 domain-containing protein n=1 Tax=Cytobacillus horneckiae TaxID=549687 RepID=UPI0019CF6D2E|nr:DUF6575 domain-containing protein [Cytobacillus horneckiae]MBN6889590.1 hypothetical protein [Cytobacillus horneckiae]MCM3180938.1 hypothetical protein [Cytobacillus horneckiae]
MKGTSSYMYIDLIGNIYIQEEIIYYDKLLTFTCKNDIGNLFVASCIELDEREQWLFLPVSEARLLQILRGSITAYEAFRNAEMGFLWKVALKANNYTTGAAEQVLCMDLEDDDLPDKEIVFDIYGEETFSIKNKDRSRIIEQSVTERREFLDISLELQESHTHEIEASFLGKVLEGTQNIVNIIAHKKGINAKIPKKIKEENKLIYTGDYAASFGIRLKSHSLANILNESDLQENLRIFMNLLEAKSDAKKITEILNGLNPAVIHYYKNFLSMLKKENVSVKTYCAFPNEEYRTLNLSLDEVNQCLKVLESDIKEITKEDIFLGKLVAIDTTTSSFKFISDDEEAISGVIDKSVNTDEYRLPKEAKVKLKIRTKLNDFTGKERIEYELLELQYQ